MPVYWCNKNKGEIHRITTFCTLPTVTMEQMATGRTTGDGIGCLNLDPFKPIQELSHDQLLEAVEWLATELRQGLDEKIDLKEQLITAKEKIYDLK